MRATSDLADAIENAVDSRAGFEGALGDNNAYSDNFFAFVCDFNKDGWNDILIIGFPGAETAWYENPKGRDVHWTKHLALAVTAPVLILILGAARKDVVITRYTAVAAPMLLTAIAAAVVSLPRGAAAVLAALAVTAGRTTAPHLPSSRSTRCWPRRRVASWCRAPATTSDPARTPPER